MCDDAAQRSRLVYSVSKRHFERVGVPNMLGFIPIDILYRSIRISVSLSNSVDDLPVGLPSDYCFGATYILFSFC